MIRDIIIITKDRQVFQQIKKACAPICGDTHSFVFARDIQSGAGLLRDRNVAVVLLGQLPREEPTFSFLSYIWKFFPDIPVINRGGFRESPESMMIEEKGIAVQPVNTLSPKKWPEVITNTLRLEKAGGSLTMSEVSIFAQMIQQEQRTCTLRVYDEMNDRSGTLVFQDGELINARIQTVQGKPAALEVLMWEKQESTLKITVIG